MDQTEPAPLCRSTSPADDACMKPRGHKSNMHIGFTPGKRSKTRRWQGGINTPARWEVLDDGHMTEADWDTWGRFR